MTLASYGKILLIVFVIYFSYYGFFQLYTNQNDYKSYFYEAFEQVDKKHRYHLVDDEKKICSDHLFRWQIKQWDYDSTKYITNDPNITHYGQYYVEYNVDKFNANCNLDNMRTNEFQFKGLRYVYTMISQDNSVCIEEVFEKQNGRNGFGEVSSRILHQNNVWFLDYYLYHTYCYRSW